MAITVPQDTAFTFDLVGRYGLNTFEEARASQDSSQHPDARPFDFIVIGAGSFGSVLATHLFNLDVAHEHRILVLEAGPFVLPEHVQNLPPDFGPPGKGNAGTVWGQPWTSDSPQSFNQDFPGLAYCVGGRSLFWGGWSPYFIESEVGDPPWPADVRRDLMAKVVTHGSGKESYLDQAARQIGTDTTNEFVYGPLHDSLRARLFSGLTARNSGSSSADVLTGQRGRLERAEDLEAPLAVASSAEQRPGFFALNKFSAVQLLLRASRIAQSEAETAVPGGRLARADALKRLMVVNNTYVTRLERSGSRITRLHVHTQAGPSSIDVPSGGRVFLALGTIESTRLALITASDEPRIDNPRIGRNLMAHLRSNLTFRVPRESLGAGLPPELQISALFVKGVHTHPKDGSKGHYHVQITASGLGETGMNSEAELFKKIPSIDDLDQFATLTDKWIVVTLRGIGEMVGDKTSPDPMNRVTLDSPDLNGVPRAKVRLETNWSDPTDPRVTDKRDPRRTKDNDLWDAMDRACEEIARIIGNNGRIEYLSHPNNPGVAHWQPDTAPTFDLRRDRLSSTHHESGTLWMGDRRETSVTDQWGQIWGTDNLYAVGPALLPTMGSPNPMLSGVALSRRLGDHLIAKRQLPPLEPGFVHLFDGTERTFKRWRAAGPGSFALIGGLLVSQPFGDHTVFFYEPERFGDFKLRLQLRVDGPPDRFGKLVGNSGVFVRFRYPSVSWPDVNQLEPRAAANPAWVAVQTGFEVQIDEQGAPDFLDIHRTGAIYGVQGQSYQAGPVLASGHWYELQVTVKGHKYTVELKDVEAARYALVTTYENRDPKRGLAPASDPRSGYVGIQAHTGTVAFRNIRISTSV
jgi:choline dehydrogenase-like flavoprotein